MKLKLDKFYLLCEAINTMLQSRVPGMAKYVWDLNSSIENDRAFFAQELKVIEERYGKIDTNSDEFKTLMRYETSDLPLLPKNKEHLLDEYPLLPIHYGLMIELVEKTKESE